MDQLFAATTIKIPTVFLHLYCLIAKNFYRPLTDEETTENWVNSIIEPEYINRYFRDQTFDDIHTFLLTNKGAFESGEFCH